MLNRGELFRKANLGKTTRLPSVPDMDYTFVGPVDKEAIAKITGLNARNVSDADLMAAQENSKLNEALNEVGMAIGRDSYETGKREAELPSQKRMAGVVLAALAGGMGINEIIEYLQGPTIEETEYYR
jgi:hypothetical protein